MAKKITKTIVLIIVIIYAGMNFASVVSDNDGKAFITNELSAYLIQFNFSKM